MSLPKEVQQLLQKIILREINDLVRAHKEDLLAKIKDRISAEMSAESPIILESILERADEKLS